ncbi:hypothetical protein ACFXOR_29205 [Streptomyces sp. NPDC059164]|nr:MULTISPECIES: hypothetical protein [unclassified Streptomyces]
MAYALFASRAPGAAVRSWTFTFVVPPHIRADAGVLNRRRVESD